MTILTARHLYESKIKTSSMKLINSVYSIVEKMLGRQVLWRISRRLYLLCRRDGSLDFESNGERELSTRLAEIGIRKKHPLIVLDVGCNKGAWTKMLLGQLKNSTKPQIFAFEPNPTLAEELKLLARELSDRAKVTVVCAAVSNKPGKLDFILATGGVHHLATEDMSEEGEKITVNVITIDDFCEKEQLDWVDMIKIDVEGFDILAMQGTSKLIENERVGIIQFEYGSLLMRTRTYLFDAFKIVEGTAYKVGKVSNKGIEVFNNWHPDIERFYGGNYVLVHKRLWQDLSVRFVDYDKTNTYQ